MKGIHILTDGVRIYKRQQWPLNKAKLAHSVLHIQAVAGCNITHLIADKSGNSCFSVLYNARFVGVCRVV